MKPWQDLPATPRKGGALHSMSAGTVHSMAAELAHCLKGLPCSARLGVLCMHARSKA